MRCSSIGPRRRLRRMSSTMDNSPFQPCSQLHGDSLNPSKRAEQTTEQKAEQNRRTDTNNAERLDEIEIASSGLDRILTVTIGQIPTHDRPGLGPPESLLG